MPLQTESLPRPTLRPWDHLIADGVVWVVLVLLLTAFRGLLFGVFRVQLSPESGLPAIGRCFGTGIPFDIQMATYAVMPSLLMTLAAFGTSLGAWHLRVRTATLVFSLTACAFAFVADLAYFAEYQDQFDHWIFGLIYDDRRAIFQTIWKGYPVLWLALGMLVAITVGVWSVGRLCQAVSSRINFPARFSSGVFQGLIPILIVGFLVIGARGSLGRRPMQLHDAATTGDVFLNKLVMNPFVALKYAIMQHRQLQTGSGLESFIPDRDISRAVRALFPQKTNAITLDDYLIRMAPGCRTKPKHIFLIVMESYDAWPMEPPFAELGLTKNLERMGKEGIQATAFVSAAGGTMPSLTTIITGLPFTDVNANYQASIRQGLPTSIASIFRRLGYRPRFFYGGYLSWQRLGEFCQEQGFEEVFGGDQMSRQLSGNEWGVDDDVLFRFILERTGAEPTFDMIMTTSYHPPYSIDLKSKGFSEESLAQTPIGRRLSPDQLRIYGHLWYADHVLGVFAEACEQRLEKPLLAVTGDHYSRRYPPGLRPSLFELTAVPFVLSGREVLAHCRRPAIVAGSHLDILPTLVSLAAPPDFSYPSSGRDLLDLTQPQVGFGTRTVVGTNFIFAIGGTATAEDLQGQPLQSRLPTDSLRLKYNQLHALGWWRVMRGDSLPTNSSTLATRAPAPASK